MRSCRRKGSRRGPLPEASSSDAASGVSNPLDTSRAAARGEMPEAISASVRFRSSVAVFQIPYFKSNTHPNHFSTYYIKKRYKSQGWVLGKAHMESLYIILVLCTLFCYNIAVK